jgi:hypothetical protein
MSGKGIQVLPDEVCCVVLEARCSTTPRFRCRVFISGLSRVSSGTYSFKAFMASPLVAFRLERLVIDVGVCPGGAS